MAEIIKGVLLEGNTTGLIDYNSLTNAPIFGDGTAKSHVEAWIAETESALEDREKEALYCYYDATTNKIYQDKELTVSLSQKDIRILVANNNKNYQRQVYCYWPTYKPGNQGRYLRLVQLGGSDTEAKFMNIFPVDGNYRFCSIRITGEKHPTAPNTIYAKEKTLDFNTMESEITKLLEGVPYIIQGFINPNDTEDAGNYNKCPISLTKDGKSVSYNEIKKQALAGRLVYCEFDQRRIPLLTVWSENNASSLVFQGQFGQTFYQIQVKSDNTQTLIWGPFAFDREVDKVINELYGVEDGKIPEGKSRLDALGNLLVGQNEWYYESIADAFNDISEKTLGKKALSWMDVEKATAKVGHNNGKLSVELVKDVDLGNANIVLQWPLDLFLNGYTLALGTIRLFGDNVRIFGGLTDGELIPVSSTTNYGTSKKGVLKAINGLGMSVCGKNCGVFGVDYMHLPTSLRSTGSITAVTLTSQAGGAENFIFSSSSLEQTPQVKVESDQYGISSSALSVVLQNCKITINENGSGQCLCVLQQRGRNMEITDCEITGTQSKSLFFGVLCSESLVSISKINLNIEGAYMGIRAQSKGTIYVNDSVTGNAGANCYQISPVSNGQIYVDGFSSLTSIGVWSGGRVYLSNCSSSEVVKLDLDEDAGSVEIGTGCDFMIDCNNTDFVFHTEKLYRRVGENSWCNGRDYEALTNYMTGSILNQLEAIVEGGV